jgi:hypothetical protein
MIHPPRNRAINRQTRDDTMKKTFAGLLLCCCLITICTACGGDKPKSAPKSAPAPGGE